MGDTIQERLMRALARVDRPGTFCVSGRLPTLAPGLEVAGVGPIGLPLSKGQAAAIKKQSRQAPYGKGTETLVDTDVRRVREIDASAVKVTNPDWESVLTQAIRDAKVELGLGKQKLSAHLYKLLLYEKGGFFLPHRDGEKLDGMVATLVVVLPSVHQGGELIVRHDGREEIVDFGPGSQFQTQYAVFYADCEHEVRPVTEGLRLALVYNLTLDRAGAKSKSKAKRVIAAPQTSDDVAAVAPLLASWAARKTGSKGSEEGAIPLKLAVLLDHKYTQAGLTFAMLKGTDRAQADVLFAAAGEAGCDASLALVTYWESGAAEDDGGYGRRSRYGRRWYDANDEAAYGDASQSKHVMEEVYETSLTAESFSDAEGNPLAFGLIPVAKEEIVSPQPMEKRTPDREDYEGYTGNEGMTLERWYHRAAVLLWPSKSRFDVLSEAGVEASAIGLEQMIRAWKKAGRGEKGALKAQCLEFAGRIISNWPERKYARGSLPRPSDRGSLSWAENRFPQEKPPRPLLSMIADLGDAALATAWIDGVMPRDACADPGKALAGLCRKHGWGTFRESLIEVFRQTTNETVERNARLLSEWALGDDPDADRPRVGSDLAEALIAFVEGWTVDRPASDWQAKTVDRHALLKWLVESLVALGREDLLGRLVTTILDHPGAYDLTTAQVPALQGLSAWLRSNIKHRPASIHRWLSAIVEELSTRASRPPEEPRDWKRKSATGCTCADCKVLSDFLEDPAVATLRLPMSKPRRQHLHHRIEGYGLDTTHVTVHRGSPHVLVLSKTKASYERALAAYNIDVEQLATMRPLREWAEKLPPEAARPRPKRAPRGKKGES